MSLLRELWEMANEDSEWGPIAAMDLAALMLVTAALAAEIIVLIWRVL